MTWCFQKSALKLFYPVSLPFLNPWYTEPSDTQPGPRVTASVRRQPQSLLLGRHQELTCAPKAPTGHACLYTKHFGFREDKNPT